MSCSSIVALFEQAQLRRFGAGTLIIDEGETSDSVYLIESGRVEVVLDNEKGEEAILAILGEGEIIGEMCLFPYLVRRSAMVRAITDTQLRCCPAAKFTAAANADPAHWMNLAGQLAYRLRQTNTRYANLAFHDIKTRIAHQLAELGFQTPPVDGAHEVKLTREQLGRLVGCSRELASRAVSELVNEGVLQLRGRTIIVRTPSQLSRYAKI